MSGHEYYELGRLTVAVSVLGGLFALCFIVDPLVDALFPPPWPSDEPAWIMADWKREWHRRRNERIDRVAPCVCWAAICGFAVYAIVTAIV